VCVCFLLLLLSFSIDGDDKVIYHDDVMIVARSLLVIILKGRGKGSCFEAGCVAIPVTDSDVQPDGGMRHPGVHRSGTSDDQRRLRRNLYLLMLKLLLFMLSHGACNVQDKERRERTVTLCMRMR